MIPALGEFALWIALPIALWGCVLAFVGGKKSRGDLVLSGERSTYAVFFLLALAAAGIITAFVQNRYEYWYVWNYSSRELPTYFKVTGLWAGQNGSLLFWALNLALFSSLAVWFNRKRHRDLMPYVNGVLLAFLSFFIAITVFVTSPFELLGFTPAEGRGLNPQLQSYWMTIHPPMLYLGFTAFTVPFAFAIAALVSGKLDSRWLTVTRKWTLTSWLFLSLGIVLGMRWAYEELGWGGYWFWDPVENASLLPWLVATAFLHSAMIQENRGMLKIWNMGLVILTFLMTIFATFLTRSGLIASVHSFAQNETIAWIFLACLGVVGAVSAVLLVHRLPLLQSDRQFESFVSREAAFLLNNLVLLGIAFAVAWGTLFPLLTEWLSSKVALGAEFFNRVNIPIGLALLVLMGIGPVIAWRRATPQNLRRNFLAPGAIGLAVGVTLFALGARHGYALATFALGAFVLSVIAIEFWKGTKARARIEEENVPTAFVHLIRRNRQRWGGYIVHVGMVFLFMGLAGSAYDAEVRQNVVPGDTIRIQSPFGHEYTLQYQGLSTHIDPGHLTRIIALFTVARDGTALAPLAPERNIVAITGQPISEVRYHTSLLEDLYVILEAYDQNVVGVMQGRPDLQEATIAVLVNPLVPWIWYGALIVLVGTLIGLWPGAGVPVRKAVVVRTAPPAGDRAPATVG